MENTKTKKSKRKIAYEIFNILVWLITLGILIAAFFSILSDMQKSDGLVVIAFVMVIAMIMTAILYYLIIGIVDIVLYYRKKSKRFIITSVNAGIAGFPLFLNMSADLIRGRQEDLLVSIIGLLLSILLITQFFIFIIPAIKEKIKKDKDKVEEETKLNQSNN